MLWHHLKWQKRPAHAEGQIMGNLLFPCSDSKEKKPTNNEINLSENCVERLLKEEKDSGKISPAAELNIPENVTEKEWMMKLKCLDDAHSNTYGLTVQAFYKLADKVESQIEPIRPSLCVPDEVIRCLQRHTCCSIKCRRIMDKFVDCVETFRINIIKERIECEMKERKRQEEEEEQNAIVEDVQE